MGDWMTVGLIVMVVLFAISVGETYVRLRRKQLKGFEATDAYLFAAAMTSLSFYLLTERLWADQMLVEVTQFLLIIAWAYLLGLGSGRRWERRSQEAA